MATNCCTAATREQQDPFLLHHLLLQDHDDDSATPARTPAAAATAARRSLLRGSTATVTKLALRWADDVLAGCFSSPCAATRQRFRRLPRADRVGDVVAPADCHDGAGDCRRQLSPVSVLDLHSDDESSVVPSQRDEHSDDDGNGKPSTSGTGTGTSPPSIHDNDHDLPGKTPTVEVERFQSTSGTGAVEIDLSASPRDDWLRLVVGGGEEEARQVAQSIDAMIFEEVRWDAVHDMLCSPQH